MARPRLKKKPAPKKKAAPAPKKKAAPGPGKKKAASPQTKARQTKSKSKSRSRSKPKTKPAPARLSCDAGVVEILEDEHGAPLSVGRKRRTIAGTLRRALYRRDRSCTFPGCTNRLFLEGHHIQHWADGGETSLSNTALLCSLHHRHVHELGYAIELGPDQRPRFRDPQGRLVPAVPEPAARTDLGWPRIRAENDPLGIDATTIAGPWDGTPVDYARIVGHLVTAEGLT